MLRSKITTLGALLLLAILSLGIGLLINLFSASPLPLRYHSQAERLQDSLSHIQVIQSAVPVSNIAPAVKKLPDSLSLDEFSTIAAGRRVLILDARPALFYRLSHVPGALSLPREDFERGYAALKSRLEEDLGQPIVIYCSDASCEDSKLVRDSLSKLGYRNLSLFESGWSLWNEAGKKQESGQ